ncbi:MAG: tetratricopeptide repeat protein, partial [Rhizobiales bacterium]|nr:tetratricopeptide repeat protein [Rhizobacter sp.]
RLGMAALRERRFDEARRLFEREMERSPEYHEFHFWLAVACAELGDANGAAVHLARAMAASTTLKDHDLYAAKLGRLKASAAR